MTMPCNNTFIYIYILPLSGLLTLAHMGVSEDQGTGKKDPATYRNSHIGTRLAATTMYILISSIPRNDNTIHITGAPQKRARIYRNCHAVLIEINSKPALYQPHPLSRSPKSLLKGMPNLLNLPYINLKKN